jgi:hypothetical protein
MRVSRRVNSPYWNSVASIGPASMNMPTAAGSAITAPA